MPNQRRPGWTSRGVAMPDELWSALRARAELPPTRSGSMEPSHIVPECWCGTKHLTSVGAVVRAACEAYVKESER